MAFPVLGGRQKQLYERTTDASGKVVIDAEGLKSAGDKVMALMTVGAPPNQTFLATVTVTLDAGDLGEELARVLGWFKEGLNLIGPNEPIEPIGHLLDQDSDLLSFAGAFLKLASTGVDHLEITRHEISKEDPRSFLRDTVFGV